MGNCSIKCSKRFSGCSTDVSPAIKTAKPTVPRATGDYQHVCSICSTVLDPTFIKRVLFSCDGYRWALFLILDLGCRIVEHIEQSMRNHSLPLIHQGFTLFHLTLTFTEQPLNTVQRTIEQPTEQKARRKPTVFKGVQHPVQRCAALFNNHLNRKKPLIPRDCALFLRPV